MRTICSRARFLLAPALGALFLLAWVLANHANVVGYVSLRSDTFATNPYVVMIAIGFALAVALSRVSSIAAFSIIGGLLLIQALFWPARFSQLSWDAYLVLPLVALFAGASGGRIFRWLALGLAAGYAVAVSALLNFPILSISGVFGTINGKRDGAPDITEGFYAWAVVGAALAVGAWFIGRHLRPRADVPSPKSDTEHSIKSPGHGSEVIESLSTREQQIFLLAAEGLTNRAIAQAASIEESTVKTHLNSISTKLGLSSRIELVAFAYREGVMESIPRPAPGTVPTAAIR